MESTLEKKDLRELAEQKLLILINKLFSIMPEDKLKVNLATVNTLITSYSHKGLTEEDYSKIIAFRRQLLHRDAVGSHQDLFCKRKQKELKKFGIQLECQFCSPTTLEKDEQAKDSSTSDKGKAVVEEEK
jgi:ribosomal protein L44E